MADTKKKKKRVSEMSNKEAAQAAAEWMGTNSGDFREDRYGSETPPAPGPEIPSGYSTLADWVVGPATATATGEPPTGYPRTIPQDIPMAPLEGTDIQQELMGREASLVGASGPQTMMPQPMAGREAAEGLPMRPGAAGMSLIGFDQRAPGEDLPAPRQDEQDDPQTPEEIDQAIQMLDQQIAFLVAERQRLAGGGQ